jgi:hypothetical protein
MPVTININNIFGYNKIIIIFELMKNKYGTTLNIEERNSKGYLVYTFFSIENDDYVEYTYDNNGIELTYRNSDGDYEIRREEVTKEEYEEFLNSYEKEFDEDHALDMVMNGMVDDLLEEDIKYIIEENVKVGIVYDDEEIQFIKRVLDFYWDQLNGAHPDNQEDFSITQRILEKIKTNDINK